MVSTADIPGRWSGEIRPGQMSGGVEWDEPMDGQSNMAAAPRLTYVPIDRPTVTLRQCIHASWHRPTWKLKPRRDGAWRVYYTSTLDSLTASSSFYRYALVSPSYLLTYLLAIAHQRQATCTSLVRCRLLLPAFTRTLLYH